MPLVRRSSGIEVLVGITEVGGVHLRGHKSYKGDQNFDSLSFPQDQTAWGEWMDQ